MASSAPSSDATATAATSNNVYVLDDEYGWIPGRILTNDTPNKATVRVTLPDDNAEEDVSVTLSDYPSAALPLQNVDENGRLIEVADMVDLSFLHEAAILYNLKARHVRAVPYTRTGDIVIAVNPYQWIDGLYCTETQDLYANTLIWQKPGAGASNFDPKSSIDPHVYETSSLAYRGLACDAQNQSILVSGESGAGKTETVKILMSHLATVQHHGHHLGTGDGGDGDSTDDDSTDDLIKSSSHNLIIKRVLDSNPLLEAFGNAKTARNDNSSRFGKFIQLQFDCESPHMAALRGRLIPSATLAGSRCVTYLLEKSRVVLHESRAERGYHVFYQLLAAPEEYKAGLWEEEDGFASTTPESFKYLGHSHTDTIEGLTDGERWFHTVEALETIGIGGDTLRMLMRAMCAVLQLGNLIFEADPNNEEAGIITNRDELNALAGLLGMDAEDVEKALTVRTVTAKHEVYKVPLNAVAAKDSCDAFAKEIYARIFDWLVRRINEATSAELNYNVDTDGGKRIKYGMVGLLDIFGFESFEVNRFEQLCINYANEKLQQKFTMDIFRSVQEEYESEGIELREVQFEDNANVLKLVEGRMGLISVLNEECVRPRGNDIAFVSKINAMNKESEILVKDNFFREYEFGIQHYAGMVVYDATNFVKKNTDALPRDLADCAGRCGNELIRTELLRQPDQEESAPSAPSPRGGRSRHLLRRQSSGSLVASTVSTKFKSQLQVLMANISETRTRYIRCIKPNTEKAPLKMHHVSTVAQLRCAGVVAAVTISRSAFPNRLDHQVVLERFSCLPSSSLAEGNDDSQATPRGRVESLLSVLCKDLEYKKPDGTVQSAFVCGKTRVYFRSGSLEYLESQRLTALSDRAVVVQRVTRRYFARSKYVTLRELAIKLQSHVRTLAARSVFVTIKNACVVMQCWTRCNIARAELIRRRQFSKAVMIQTHWRMTVALARLYSCRHAAVKIQAMARGAYQRPVYKQMLADAIEEAKIENQLKTLQRKLEEAEAKRIEAEKKAAAGGSAAPQTVVVYRDSGEEKKNEVQPGEEQQTLMDESGKMLEYLRKEVFKLRSQNAQLRKDFDLVRENNQRLMDSNASAGASFAALNQHAKQLNRTNAKLMTDVQVQKQMVSKLHMAQMELKEELKMKQSTYIAEVQSRLMYQKTMGRMVDLIQARCADDSLVEDILAMHAACDSDYMSGPTGINTSPPSRGSPPRAVSKLFSRAVTGTPESSQNEMDNSLSGKVMSFFGMGSPSPERPKAKSPGSKEQLSGLEAFSGNFTEM